MKDICDAFIEYKKKTPFILKKEIIEFNNKFPLEKLKELNQELKKYKDEFGEID